MFCKWCGSNLTNSDRKCKRCGKEVPALSDCGGFYDLVKLPKEGAVPIPTPSPAQPAASVSRPQPAPVQKKAKKPLAWMVVAAVGYVLALVILLVMRGQVADYADRIDRLENKLEELEELTDPTDSADSTDPTGDTTLPEEDSKWWPISFDVSVSEDAEKQTVTLAYETDSQLYGASQLPASCTWQYRTQEDQQWQELTEDLFTAQEEPGMIWLSIAKATLKSLANENKALELRCEISGEAGGFCITVEGILLVVDENQTGEEAGTPETDPTQDSENKTTEENQ